MTDHVEDTSHRLTDCC